MFRSRAGPGGVHDRSVPDQHGGTIVIDHVLIFVVRIELLCHCHAAVTFSPCPVQEIQVVTVVHQKIVGTSQDWSIDNNKLHCMISRAWYFIILSIFDMW